MPPAAGSSSSRSTRPTARATSTATPGSTTIRTPASTVTPEWRGVEPCSSMSASTASSAGAASASSPWKETSTSCQDGLSSDTANHASAPSDAQQPGSASPSASFASTSRSSASTSIKRTSKLATISPRQQLSKPSAQPQGPQHQQPSRLPRSYLSPQHFQTSLSRSAATTPTAGQRSDFSPPRASLESIQRRLYEEGVQDSQQAEQQQHALLTPNDVSSVAAAAALVLHALQSPAKIGSSPANGRGISSIFPPSPDAHPSSSLAGSLRGNRQAIGVRRIRARSRSLQDRAGNEDESEDDEDTDVSPAPHPTRRRSLKDRQNACRYPQKDYSPSDASKEHALSASLTASRLPKKRFDLSDWQFDLAAIASAPSPAEKTPTSRSFPSSLKDEDGPASPASTLKAQSSLAELKGPHTLSNKTSKASIVFRDPFKLKRSDNATFSARKATSEIPPVHSDLPGKTVPMTAPSKQRDTFSLSRAPLQHRPHQPQPQTSFGQAGSASLFGTPLSGDSPSSFSHLAASARRSSRPQLSRTVATQQYRTHSRNKSAEQAVKDARISGNTASSATVSLSFDACASAARQRQRTKSISESEGNASDTEDDVGEESLNLPESPDLVMDGAESRDGYIEAGIFSGMSVSDRSADNREMPLQQTSAYEMQLDEDKQGGQDSASPKLLNEFDDSHDSLFLDTPGRSRGSSMPSGPQTGYTLTPSVPFPQPQLKPSRVSYPPKILYSARGGDESDTRAKNPLHSSVPASTRNSQTSGTSQQGLDQLFLASILNGTTALTSASLSVTRQPSVSLSKSTSNSATRKTGETLRGAKSLQPLSTNASQIGRKRNAHGAMVTNGGLRESLSTSRSSKVGDLPDSLAHIEVPRGRPSLDGSTDEEWGISPTLPPLTDSSSATSSLASSQRSGQFPKPAAREGACKTHRFSEMEDADVSVNLDDLSFLSDSTAPTLDDRDQPAMPRTFSTSRDLASATKSSGQLKSPGTPGLPSGIPRRTSPHFRNVRPLQAAFLNSGLISKKSIRSRLGRDSGIGLVGTPPAPALRRLLNQDRRDSSNMHSTPGSQPSLSFGTPSHCSTSFASTHFGSPVPTVEIAPSKSMEAEGFANASSASLSRRMPDTPCKRQPLYPHIRQVATTVDCAVKGDSPASAQGLHPLAQCSRPTTGRSASSCSSTISDSSSVVNSIPGSAVKLKQRPFMSPSFRQGAVIGNKSSRKSNTSGSPSSAGSPCANQELGPRSIIPRRKIGPALFRRRSSGQIQTSTDGSFKALSERSGGSNRSGIVDWEPMTPTRTCAEQEWLTLPALATSPQAHARTTGTRPFLTTDTAVQAEVSMLSPTSPLATSPLATQSTRFIEGHRDSDFLPRPSMPVGKALQRPAYRARHSSSVVQTARQSELLSPDRFSSLFSITRTLGQGEFSEAFEVRDRGTDEVYAVKKTKVPLAGHKARLRRLEEVDILRLLSCQASFSPFVIRLFDAWEQGGNLYIQTELCPFGNLAFFLEEYGRMYETLDEARVWKILAEVASGVSYIHQHGVLHLDLKPANIFIASNGSLKIGDFGLATRWPRVWPITILQGAAVNSPGWDATAASSVWLSERSRSKGSDEQRPSDDLEREGDREYIAPEILRGQYGRPADMFALGLVILEAAANVVLPDNGLPWRKLREDDLSDVDIGHLSDELVYIIVNLLRTDPAVRTTIDELQTHPVISKMQRLRQKGLEFEALPSGCDEMPEEANGTVTYAKGAIVEENEDFLPSIMAEVRRIWHSPRQSKMPVSQLLAREENSQMEIDT